MRVLLVLAAYGCLFLSGEILNRSFRISPQVTRLSIHLLSGLFAASLAAWLSREEIMGLAIFFVLTLFVSKRLSVLQSIHNIPRMSWGEIFFPAGIGLAAYLYLPHNSSTYYLSVLILALCDPLANILGTRVRSAKTLFGKSLLGSAAFLLSSMLISLFFLPPGNALLLSAVVTAVEAVSPYGSDNLTIVAAVGLASLI